MNDDDKRREQMGKAVQNLRERLFGKCGGMSEQQQKVARAMESLRRGLFGRRR